MLKYYSCCRLRRNLCGVVQHRVELIRNDLAKIGQKVKIKDGDDWQRGWKIIDIWERKIVKGVVF